MGRPRGRRAAGRRWRETERRIWAILNAAAEQHRRFQEQHERSKEEHERSKEEHERSKEEHERSKEERQRFQEQHQRFQEQHQRFQKEHQRLQEEHRRSAEEEHRRSAEEHRRFEEEHRRAQEEIRAARVRQDRMDEQLRQTGEQLRQTDEQLRRTERMFVSNWGKLVESLVEGDLLRLLQERNLDVTRVAQRLELGDPLQRELDLLAWNGTEAVAVEVKTTLKVDDVRRFEALLEDLPGMIPFHRGGGTRLYGAVAYLRADESASVYAKRRGLFVIRATGNSARIENPVRFRPRDFSDLPDPPAAG